MLDVNFTTADNVTTDSLYQWDINQVLSISGLSLSVVPSIHFCNKKSKSALVVNCKASGSAITCNVPNTLLSEPYDIIGYIYTVSNNEAKTVYAIKIPVTPRVMPNDYLYDDNIQIHGLEAIESSIETLNASVQEIEDNAQATDGNVAAVAKRVTTLEANCNYNKGVLTDTDLDTLKTPGNYWINGHTCTNSPIDDYGALEVVVAAATLQRFTAYPGGVYNRIFANAAWTAWRT